MGLSTELRRRAPGFGLGLGCGLLAKELGLRGLVSYWGPVAPVAVLFAIIGALLWPRRGRWLIASAVMLCSLWLVVAFSPLVRWMVPGLIRADSPTQADAIFVLSSNVQHDDEPSDVALARATRALELLGEGRAPRLLLSELRPPAGSYVKWARATAHRMGIAHADDIEGVGYVYNTHDEALRVAELFARRGWRSLLLVTSPTHSRRSKESFERAGIPNVISVPSMETDIDVENLESPDGRIYAFGMIIHEWVGLLVYRWRGWI